MNYEDIKKIIDDMGNANIDELNIEFPDGTKVGMKKNTGTKNVAPIIQVPQVPGVQVNNNVAPCEEKQEEKCNIVKSPMVGTFYSSSSPKEAPYVKVGDKVKKGDVLCIVEAMKLMNEIEADYDGEIIEICVNNEDIVEYGTPLFKIK